MSDSERIYRLEGQVDALKVVRPMIITVVSAVLAALVFVIGFLGVQVQSTNARIGEVDARLGAKIDAVDAKLGAKLDAMDAKIDAVDAKLSAKIDAIPDRLAEEFRAMRAEMSAQTAAIAASITATKAQTPQVILMQQPAPGKPGGG